MLPSIPRRGSAQDICLMVTETIGAGDIVEGNLEFLVANALDFGWISDPDSSAPGKGTGADRKVDENGKRQEPTVAKVARAHELSLGNLESVQPPRSVLVATVEEDTLEIEVLIDQLIAPAVVGDIEARTAMSLLGEGVVDLAKNRYRNQTNFKPLSDARKKQKVRAGKSGDQARLNTGQEINSLRYRIGAD
jgi:hypothetical protein